MLHAERTRITRTANTFTVLFARVSHKKQTHLWFCVHVFHTRSKHVCHFVRTRFTLEEHIHIFYARKLAKGRMHFPGGEYICAKRWFIVTMGLYITLVSVQYLWLALLLAQ